MVACLAARNFQDGTRLSFVVTTEYNWAIGLANQSWTLQRNGTTDIAAYVDQKFIASGKAWHLDNRVAFLPLTGAEAYHALQKGQRLELQTPYGYLTYALAGSGKAMYAVLGCIKTLLPQQGIQPAADARVVPQAETMAMLTNSLNVGLAPESRMIRHL
jgi:hypothetical protein